MWYVFRFFKKIDEYVFALAVGNDDTYARLLDFRGGGVFGVHATTSEGTLLWLYIRAEVTFRLDQGDEFR